MILRNDIKRAEASVHYFIEIALNEHKEHFLTKEELFSFLPCNENDVCLYTISAFERALGDLARARVIEIAYFKGVRYFGYKADKEMR